MNRPPKITIFCPSYNHENYVADTLESIVKQTYSYTQVIIIDDASADSTPQIVKEYASKYPDKIKYIQGTENLGVGNRWNQMIKMIDGEYLACIGSDDILPLDAIEKRVAFMEENRDIDLLLTEFDLLVEGNVIHKGKEKLDIVPQFKSFYEIGDLSDLYVMLLNGNFIQIGAGLIRLGSYDEDTKLLDPHLYHLQDYDQLLKLILNHKIGFIQDSTYLYRWHGTNTSSIKNPKRNEYDVAAEMVVILSGQLIRKQSILQRAKTIEIINYYLNSLKLLSEVESDNQLKANSPIAMQNENITTENYIMENIAEIRVDQNQWPKIEDDDNKLEFTGERFVPELGGQMAYEHMHRYAFASELVKDKKILDIASGEGFGSALLSKVAEEVIGVDISEQAINHAKKKYQEINNLSFHVGECKSIPAKDNYFDVVISFETLEHIREQKEFLAEIKRVLKKNGILVISTPNKKIYTDDKNFDNPYHLLELNEQDFYSLLNSNFEQTHLWGQRLTFSSHVWPISLESKCIFKHYQSSNPKSYLEKNEPPFDAEYFIAVCSDVSNIPENFVSLYTGLKNDMIAEFKSRGEWGNALQREVEQKNKKIQDLQTEISNLTQRNKKKTSEENNAMPNMKALVEVSEIHIKQQNYFEAYLLLQKVLKENSSDESAIKTSVALDEQIEIKKKEKKWNSKKSVKALHEAEKSIEDQQFGEAKIKLIEVLNLEPDHIEALNDLSVVNILENNIQFANELINTILRIEPTNEVALGNLNYIQQMIEESNEEGKFVSNSQIENKEYEVIACPFCNSWDAEEYRKSADIVKCKNCDTIYLRHRFTKEAMYKWYQSFADGDSHMALPSSIEEAKNAVLRRNYWLQEVLKYTEPKGILLDIGCGWGAFLDNARDNGFSPRGIEMTKKCVKYANDNLKIMVTNDQFEDTYFEQNSINVITMNHVFEHLPYPLLALKKVHKILVNDGLFCGIVPNISSFVSRNLTEKWYWLEPNNHYVHYAPDTLKKHLEQNGFKVERLYTATGDYGKQKVIQEINNYCEVNSDAEEILNNLENSLMGEEIRFIARKI